jgi:hypothetical protein
VTIKEFQAWLNAHGASLAVDGVAGAQTKRAVLSVFANKQAPAASNADIAVIAARIGCTPKQVRAVAAVESGGSAFDAIGRPKILFERHYFHRLTEGKWSITEYSNPSAGGYAADSWLKLADAAARDPWAAFQSASWGKFQVMGAHWKALGYDSPLDMAWAMRESEMAHYDALARFVKVNGLADDMARLSTNPADNVGFARKYNGPGYAKYAYDQKLARAML